MGNKLASKSKSIQVITHRQTKHDETLELSTSNLMLNYIRETTSSLTIPSDDFNFMNRGVIVPSADDEVQYTLALINEAYQKYLEEEKPKRLTIPRTMTHRMLVFLSAVRGSAELSKNIDD